MSEGYPKSEATERLVPNTALLGMWIFLACVVMLFASFVSAYLVRSVGVDWKTSPLPGILWWNTVIILASSVTCEIARRGMSGPRMARRAWLWITIGLGTLFLAGQLGAWRELSDAGYFVSTNPHSSFFYILTGMHGLHLISGLLFLVYALLTISDRTSRFRRNQLLPVSATYWHFLTGLWLVLFGVLYFWL